MRLIDADEIRKDLEWQMDRNNPNWSWNNEVACLDLLKYLDNFKTIDSVKHGKWIKCGVPVVAVSIDGTKENFEYDAEYVKCSECHTVADFDTKYCPDCGAKMDGVSDA